MQWTEKLKANPIPWLLEEENPPVRCRTLLHLLDRPHDDPEVQRAKAAIPSYPPVSDLLGAQKPDGYWVQRDFYLPKHNGTFWVLTVLAELGLTAREEQVRRTCEQVRRACEQVRRACSQVRRACEFMFGFQRDGGAFCRPVRVPGRGLVAGSGTSPCTQARIVRFLIQLGYGDDPRLRVGIDWLLANAREDGMWDCGAPSRPGCLRATLDVLHVAALDAKTAADPATARAAAIVSDLLMEPRMTRYHVGHAWQDLEYPYFGYGLLPTLASLADLGFSYEHPKIASALEYVLSRQLSDGAWPVDQVPYRTPFDFGQPGAPSKWITLDALRAIKGLFSQPGD